MCCKTARVNNRTKRGSFLHANPATGCRLPCQSHYYFMTSNHSSPNTMKASYKPLETSNSSDEEEQGEEVVTEGGVQPGQIVAIVAPSDLPGGYEFTAVIDDQDVIVAVVSSCLNECR